MKIFTYTNRQWYWKRGRMRSLVGLLMWRGVVAVRVASRIVWVNY